MLKYLLPSDMYSIGIKLNSEKHQSYTQNILLCRNAGACKIRGKDCSRGELTRFQLCSCVLSNVIK